MHGRGGLPWGFEEGFGKKNGKRDENGDMLTIMVGIENDTACWEAACCKSRIEGMEVDRKGANRLIG